MYNTVDWILKRKRILALTSGRIQSFWTTLLYSTCYSSWRSVWDCIQKFFKCYSLVHLVLFIIFGDLYSQTTGNIAVCNLFFLLLYGKISLGSAKQWTTPFFWKQYKFRVCIPYDFYLHVTISKLYWRMTCHEKELLLTRYGLTDADEILLKTDPVLIVTIDPWLPVGK